jgi:hypothetical protein
MAAPRNPNQVDLRATAHAAWTEVRRFESADDSGSESAADAALSRSVAGGHAGDRK